MKKTLINEILGRVCELVLLLGILMIISHKFNLLKWDLFSSASIIFVLGGGLFEMIIRRKFRTKNKKKSKTIIERALIYVHLMPDYQKKYGDLYEFSDNKKLIINCLVYLIVFLYVLIVYLLYTQFGKLALLIYIIPALTNINSFFKQK